MLTIFKHCKIGLLGAVTAGMIGVSGCGTGDEERSAPGGEVREEVATHISSADFPYYETAADMYASSTTVVTGKIIAQRVEVIDISIPMVTDDEAVNAQAGEQIGKPVPADMVFTVYTVQIEDVVKRELSDFEPTRDTIEVKIPGGKIDDTDFVLQGAPRLAIDAEEDFVLFLEEYGSDMPASPLNSDQAVLQYDDATGKVSALEESEVSATFLRDVQKLATD